VTTYSKAPQLVIQASSFLKRFVSKQICAINYIQIFSKRTNFLKLLYVATFGYHSANILSKIRVLKQKITLAQT